MYRRQLRNFFAATEQCVVAQDRIAVSHAGEVCAWPRETLDDIEPNPIRNEGDYHRRYHADVFEP